MDKEEKGWMAAINFILDELECEVIEYREDLIKKALVKRDEAMKV